jgi:secondary thiamine-phosphate synthase enzyme
MNLQVETKKEKEVLEITALVEKKIAEAKIKEGLCNLFLKHTTAALTTGEVGEGTGDDLLETVQKIIPKINFRHLHNPSHAPDHMIASILGPSLAIPIQDGKLQLGRWQRVLLVELNGPKSREVIISVQPLV